MTEVVCGVLIQNGYCLIGRRSYGSYKGWYEFPGGKVEAGESKEEALRREIREELDIEIESVDYLASSEDDQDYPFSLTCFLCTSKETPYRSDSHDALIWTTPEHIYDFPFFESDRILVEALKEVWPCYQKPKK